MPPLLDEARVPTINVINGAAIADREVLAIVGLPSVRAGG